MSDAGFLVAQKKKINDPKRIGLWKIGRTLGTGSSGRVRIARHTKTGQHAAVKIVSKVAFNSRTSINHLAEESDRARLAIEREIVVMKLLDHPNIMRLYDVWETSSELFLILEYVQGGELFDYLCQKGKLPIAEAVDYFQQIISAIDYCHQFNVAHRDLKPENILLDKDSNIKIADFGMAAWQVNQSNGMLRTSCGSPHYAAPEIINGEEYRGSAADTWSCGIILYALLTGKLPFDHENCGVLLNQVRAGKYDIPEDVDPIAQDLIRHMLTKDATKRITVPEVMQHPFFNLCKPKLAIRTLPKVIEAAGPIRDEVSIDPHIFSNLKTLWHDIPDDVLVDTLLGDEPTLQKGIYRLLMEFRSKHPNLYQEEEDRAVHQSLERRKSKKSALSKGENIIAPHSFLPPRTDPPTPRRAAGRFGILRSDYSRSIFECYRTAAVSEHPLSSSISNSTLRLQPPSVSSLQGDEDALSRQRAEPTPPTTFKSDSDFHHSVIDPLTGVSETNDYRHSPSPDSSIISAFSLLNISYDQVLGNFPNTFTQYSRSCTKPLSICRKAKRSIPRLDSSDKENIREGSAGQKSFSNKEGKRMKIENRTQIVHPKKSTVPEWGMKQENKNVFSLASTRKASPSSRSSPSSSRTWFGNVFGSRPATLSLLSVHDVPTTRNECRRLLMDMGVQVMIKDPDGLSVFKCKSDEAKERWNLSGNAEFRVVFQRPKICDVGRSNKVLMMSLTLIHERGSLNCFKRICKTMEKSWSFDTPLPKDG